MGGRHDGGGAREPARELEGGGNGVGEPEAGCGCGGGGGGGSVAEPVGEVASGSGEVLVPEWESGGDGDEQVVQRRSDGEERRVFPPPWCRRRWRRRKWRRRGEKRRI